ncbi:hypothetical protein, unknown function [Leishmania infantum JPCM5]|uniref:Uncharacterized protein n=2 Tax=Leishmania infantum TaxID=5671 RepID=A4HVN5_LEIIN|nr:hypothetical protein, unknown function [Leishmania infantum JPCM5]CAC9466194.1 hypothetical_protein_-_conserved [Leishmania infantum]CAM66502.2 hypothetical protein, unknown function [Leishmania infantum JPCM5]SUZ40157.1 hypothetical_protein_-_conserved [Leishmania infantum]|eukprot:XP_001464126.2 hypothetical protein, unknown function [Leishmania infantum JPCM5]
MDSSRLLVPLALNPSDIDKVSGADSTGARHVYGSTTAVSTAQANKRRESEFCEAASVAGAEEVLNAPVGELECMASGFLSISDYIFVAESLKTVSARMLEEVGVNNRGAMSGGANAPLRQIVVDHHPDAATALTASWVAMRDALVARKRGSVLDHTSAVKSRDGGATIVRGATGISGFASSTTTAAPQRDDHGDAERAASYSKMKSLDDAETTDVCDETAPHLFNTEKADWSGDDDSRGSVKTRMGVVSVSGASLATHTAAGRDDGLGSESEETTEMNKTVAETGKGAAAPTTPLTSRPMDTVAPMANLNGVFSVTGHVPDRVPFPHLPSQPLAELTRVPAPQPRPLSMSDLTAIAEQDDVVDFYLQSLAKRVRGIESKLRVMNPSSVLRFFLTSALSDADSSGMSALLPATTSVPVRLPGCVDDSSAADPQSSGTWISKKEIVLPAMNKEEAQAAQTREDALAAMGGDLVRLFSDTKDITLRYMLIFAESMPLGINSRLNHDYLLPTAAIPENYVGCGVHARRKKDFFVSMTERVALLSGHHSFRTPETLLLGISQLSNLASQMMSSFALGAVLGCVSRWRELHKSGHTASDEVVETMERFATAYCTGYKILMNDAFPTMRKQYPNLFIVSSFAVKEENSGGAPPMLTVAMSIFMKLLFLFAGGRESIRADDRRMMADALREEQQRRAERRTPTAAPHPSPVSSISVAAVPPVAAATARLSESAATTNAWRERAGSAPRNAASLPVPVAVDATGDFSLVCSEGKAGDACKLGDDVALAVALQVPSATLIVDMGALLMSGPLAAHRSTAALVRTARAVSCTWRVLFQAAGLLPFGRACPVEMAKWLPLFPLYTLSTGAKHVMLSVHARAAGQTPLNFGPVLREDALQSAVDFIQDSARAQDEKKLSVLVLGTTTSEWSLHLSPTAIESSPASRKGGMSWPSTLTLGSPVVPVIAAAEKPVAPMSAQRSYHLHPSFTAAPAHSWSSTLNEDSFHAKPTVRATPGIATEQRQDFYELCARQSAAPFLPGVNITNQVHAFPLPGGVAMLRVEKLADRSPATVQRLKTYHDRLALIMSWRRVSLSHSHSCTPATDEVAAATATGQTGDACITTTVVEAPVHEGDELTIRWGNPPKGRAAATAMSVQASFCNPSGFMNRRSSTAVQSIAVSEAAQTASAAAVLSAQESVDSNESHARAHSSHYPTLAAAIRHKRKSLLFFATAFSSAAPPPPPRSQKTSRAVSLETVVAAAPAVEPTEESLPDVHVPAMQRRRICLILATANPREFLVVLDTPNSIAPCEAASLRTPSVVGVLHHRRHCAPFTREVSRECVWTNPEFAQSSSAGVPAPGAPPLSWAPAGLSVITPAMALQVPVLLGWLLGQSAGNEEIFTLPLPPLAFRILGLAVQLELPIDAVQLTTADMSLLYPDWTNTTLREQLLQGLRELHSRQETQREEQAAATLASGAEDKRTVGRGILDDLCISGSPAVALRQHQRKKELIDVSLSIMWNIQRDGTVAGHAFWAAVLQGMRQTPLLDTPLFAQCSSRTVREVLCGSYDHLDEDFTFRRSFMLLVEDDATGEGSSAAGGAATQLRGDRHFARKSVLRVLDELPLKEKRLLLRFITGHSLRTRRSQMDTLRLVLQSGFARAPPRCGKAKPPVCMPSGSGGTQPEGVAMVGGGVVSAETASLAGADEDHSHTTASSYLTASAEAVARACVDATLQLLPVAHPSEKTLVFPNYFEALIMGSYRKRVLGADLPAFNHASGTATTSELQFPMRASWGAAAAAAGGHTVSCAANSAESCVSVPASVNGSVAAPFFDSADVQLAWTQLTVTQQETLRRRYRELLRHRLRAALYVYLLSNADTVEEAWELGLQMGFTSRAVRSGVASTTAAEPGGCASREYNDDVGGGIALAGGTFMRCDDGTVVFVERETDENDDGVAGDVHGFGVEDDLDDDLLEADGMVLAAASKEMTLDAAAHAASEERGGGGTDTATPGNTDHAGQQKRPLLPSDQLTSSVGTLHGDLCGDSTRGDSLNGYCIAATFRFPEDSEEDAGEMQTAAAGVEVVSGCEDGSINPEATSSSATVTLHNHDARADVARELARELARDGTQASHPAPPASSGASAEAAKCPMSDDQSLVPMAVAPPRHPSLLKVSMITPLWKAQMTAAAASARSSSMAFTGAAVKAAGAKTAVQAATNGGSRDASMKATSTPDVAVTAHGVAGLSRESKDAHLRSEIDSCIRELFSDDAP